MTRFNLNMGGIYDYMQGRTGGSLGRRQGRETGAQLMALVEGETDPKLKAWLMQQIQLSEQGQGAFAGLGPDDAAQAVGSILESRRAESMNMERDKRFFQLLSTQYPGIIPPELAEQFGVDATTGTGAKADRLQTEIMSRLGQQQSGYEQSETRRAQEAAAGRGYAVSPGDEGQIRARAATMFGRQRGTELAGLQQRREGERERILGQIGGALRDTTYQAGGYGALRDLAANRSRGGTIGTWNLNRNKGGNRWGVGFRQSSMGREGY